MFSGKKGEVLAPVGNKEMLLSAVRSGADAVYLGAKDFSARRNAENFSADELSEVARYCHIRNVKVYLTLNILIKENELESAFSLAKEAYNSGIDGIIVQDLGLAKIIHEKLPDFHLHASTQMSVHSESALYILKELGFKRVVASREMSKQELIRLCETAKKLGLEIEVFVHGALCMCVSGQCLLSAFLGSRSGNRGLCAGPCRLPFSAENGTGYDLSLKDLSLTKYISELENTGVASYKIEGRMKRPEYVAAAVSAVRHALDYNKTDDFLEKTLKDVFSRQGFTDGYYTSHLGRDMFGIRTKEDVVSAQSAFPKIHELYRNENGRVKITASAEIKENKPVTLTLSDGENTVTATGNIPQTAKNKALTKEDAEKSILKFGSTPYFCEKAEISLSGGLFVPSGELNALRRNAAELLSEKRAVLNRSVCDCAYENPNRKSKRPEKQKFIIRLENEGQMPEDLSGIDGIILPIYREPCFPEDFGGIKIAEIPRFAPNERETENRLRLFKENGVSCALAGNLSAIKIAKELGFSVFGGTGLNVTNSESIKVLQKIGVQNVIMSAEELLHDTGKIPSDIGKGITVYGNIPLMLTRNCPLKNGRKCSVCDKKGVLTDRLGAKFPVMCRPHHTEILNSVPLWLADRKNDYSDFDFAVLYFGAEEKAEVERVISAYKNETPPYKSHTRGLYFRGTL